VVLASFATSEMVGWAKVLETITHDRDRVNIRRDCFNVRESGSSRIRLPPDRGRQTSDFRVRLSLEALDLYGSDA
jgi:hypothetical protein